MLPKKRLVVAGKTREVDTIEQALKDLAKDVKRGDVSLPFTVTWEDPAGATFIVEIREVDAITEISTRGFMY